MIEGKIRIARGELLPKPPNATALFPHIDVMKQHDPARTHFRQPRVEVACNGFISMRAVQMQQVDAPIRKELYSFAERMPQQVREMSVSRIVIGAKLIVNLLPEMRCMIVSLPMVDSVTSRRKAKRLNRLQKGAVGVP